MIIEIPSKDSHLYIPFRPGKYSSESPYNVSMCKYFCKIQGEDGWTHIKYFYDKKSKEEIV